MDFSNIIKDRLKITDQHDYFCLIEANTWKVVNSRDLKDILNKALSENPRTIPIMSLRLATGLMGEIDCLSGNNGPKGSNEVVIGIGKKGINGLLKLGGLPCVTCHSGRRLSEMDNEITASLINNVQNISNADNAEWLTSHYDARRLNWGEIIKLKVYPTRFYTRPNLSHEEILNILSIFKDSPNGFPVIGFYDVNSETKFTEYEV